MMVDLASVGYKILYVTLEQSPGWLKDTIENRIFKHRRKLTNSAKEINIDKEKSIAFKNQLKELEKQLSRSEKANKLEDFVADNFFIDSSLPSMENLPDFFIRQVVSTGAQYKGIKVMVVDSLQGLGTAPTSSRPYANLYEFNRWAKEEGITCLLIGHITKSGQIAGPRSLEHNVDCVLYIRKAMRLRPLFVPKNRFGAERHEPFTLITDQWGCLERSKHMSAISTMAYGFIPGSSRFIETQALVKLPKFGAKPGILAPYLPRQKLRQLIGIISSIKDVDISDLTFEINCYIPAGGIYSQVLDFPIAASMLASYFQQALPNRSLFIGELDLSQQIRPLPDESLIVNLRDTLVSPETNTQIRQIFMCSEQSSELKDLLSEAGSDIKVIGISNLEEFIRNVWPEVIT